MAGARHPASNGTDGIHGTWLTPQEHSPVGETVPGTVGSRCQRDLPVSFLPLSVLLSSELPSVVV